MSSEQSKRKNSLQQKNYEKESSKCSRTYIEEEGGGGFGYPSQGKGLDLGAEPPRIELCGVPP